MSWDEIKMAVNSDIQTPLNKKIENEWTDHLRLFEMLKYNPVFWGPRANDRNFYPLYLPYTRLTNSSHPVGTALELSGRGCITNVYVRDAGSSTDSSNPFVVEIIIDNGTPDKRTCVFKKMKGDLYASIIQLNPERTGSENPFTLGRTAYDKNINYRLPANSFTVEQFPPFYFEKNAKVIISNAKNSNYKLELLDYYLFPS